ncbi:MAG: DNA-directed RNA polymerase subunit omega [Trueperaceae bacterium]|jgi:DNA-directed RNA polymerase subunit omega|nr:DNA-directed RNA polymerase subunit omega [Truepera sp.]HRN17558.1 DNA-directed RNA polymerase subunit omega [Trueperaceae bacterium]HRQ09865.1 DNA-directed RNA polymerase subunit omega [Trueperaceae bacterium]
MAQEGYDKLIALTDSRYRLSMIVARRAAQLKMGIPTVLEPGTLSNLENSVTVAMKELETDAGIKWGDDLPPAEEFKRLVEVRRPDPISTLSATPFDDDEED